MTNFLNDDDYMRDDVAAKRRKIYCESKLRTCIVIKIYWGEGKEFT